MSDANLTPAQGSVVPRHVAVVMDGNGRWAVRRSLPRTAGHRQGAETVRKIVEAAANMGIEYLTLFGFSTENWSRPAEEVGELMRLMRYYLKKDLAELHEKNVRVRMIGDRSRLDPDLLQLIENAESTTIRNSRINLTIAFSYGGRAELIEAARRLATEVPVGEINEQAFSERLMTADLPDVDLFIRTSGEKRISNFLLWQSAYAELHFTDTLWPDFGRDDLELAVKDYNQRDRRFGGIGKSASV